MERQSPAAALRGQGLKPRKRLGQNFLRDTAYLRRIVEAADLTPRDQVLEIGAGTGVLTAALLEHAGRVVAIELDDSLYDLLQREFAGNPRLELRHGNALDVDPCQHFAGPYKLVGNIPYYVTGPIIRHFLETPCRPEVLVLMVQREVADRMVATPGELSLLGVSVQYYATPRIVTRVPAGAFYPRPKVDSAIIKLVPHAEPLHPGPELFFPVLRAGFSAPRKQIANALAKGLGVDRQRVVGELLQRSGIAEQRRAETLSIPEWLTLAKTWEEMA